MKLTDCEKHEKQLRQDYVNASPAKRWNVIRQRLEFPACGPNLLVAHVAAVESLARSIALNPRAGIAVPTYEKLRQKNARDLLAMVARQRDKTPEELFTGSDWESMECAEIYRNLLVHEGTFLRQGITTELVGVCKRVIECLRKLYGTQ